jgi:hypothetical protein
MLVLSKFKFKMKKINEIAEEIEVRLTQAEEYANKGDVDESKRLIDEVDELKKRKTELEVNFIIVFKSLRFEIEWFHLRFNISKLCLDLLCNSSN